MSKISKTSIALAAGLLAYAFLGEGFVVVTDPSNFTSTSLNSFSMNPSTLGSNFTTPKMTATLGTVTITT